MKAIKVQSAAAIVAAILFSATAEPYRDGDRVVFFGDSLTHGSGYPETVSLYYATRFPERDIRFSNSGWAGAAAAQGLISVDEDVAAKKPTVVSVMFGMNDCGYWNCNRRGMTPTQAKASEDLIALYGERMPRLIADIRRKAGNPRIQYVTPSPYDQNAVCRGEQGEKVANDALRRMAQMVRAWAKADAADCIDLQEGLLRVNEREQALDPTFSVLTKDDGSSDRIHPGRFGHTLFAYFWLKAQRVPSVVSRLEVDARTGHSGSCANAAISELSVVSNAVSFTALEKALPYPLEGPARQAAKCVPFVEDLNRETLVVKNLAPGGYDIFIDGVEVTSRSAGELADGVELAGLTNTPQYVQAKAVMIENRRFWDGERTIRDFVTRRRWLRTAYRIDPDDRAAVRRHVRDLEAKCRDRPPSYDLKMARFYFENYARNDEIRADTERCRRRVRELARPVPHRWTIRPSE